MIAARLSQGDGPGRCKMLQRVFRVVLVFSLLNVIGFAANRVSGLNSASAGIFLRAVVEQSVSISAQPEFGLFDSFVANARPNVPVTFKAKWLRGPGVVRVVIFSGSGPEQLVVPASSDTPSVEIQSGSLPSSDNKNDVLTIRAQVI
jgi:hypothetical protein